MVGSVILRVLTLKIPLWSYFQREMIRYGSMLLNQIFTNHFFFWLFLGKEVQSKCSSLYLNGVKKPLHASFSKQNSQFELVTV